MKNKYIDVMVDYGLTFYRSLIYKYNPKEDVDGDKMYAWIYERCPSLVGRDDVKIIVEG